MVNLITSIGTDGVTIINICEVIHLRVLCTVSRRFLAASWPVRTVYAPAPTANQLIKAPADIKGMAGGLPSFAHTKRILYMCLHPIAGSYCKVQCHSCEWFPSSLFLWFSPNKINKIKIAIGGYEPVFKYLAQLKYQKQQWQYENGHCRKWHLNKTNKKLQKQSAHSII